MKAWTIGGRLIVDSQGRVILCDVCPCPPIGCCLYPSPFIPFPDPALYPDTDLPDEILLFVDSSIGSPFTLIKDIGLYSYSGAGFNPDGGSPTIYKVYAEYINWYVDSDDQTVAESPCLIGNAWTGIYSLNTTDEFLSVYHFTYNAIEYTLTRESLCYWKVSAVGHEAAGPDGIFGLYYESFIPYTKETVAAPFNLCWVLNFVDPDENYIEIVKDDPQSSPDGSYASGFITVSP